MGTSCFADECRTATMTKTPSAYQDKLALITVEYVSAYILPDATQEARGKYVCIGKHAYYLAGEGRIDYRHLRV
jgi:hypothetical protein